MARGLRMLIWYWGRRGGGAWFAYEVARSLSELDGVELSLSLSRQSHLLTEFRKLGLPTQEIDTYSGPWEFLAASRRLPGIRRAFRAFLREREIDVVVCPMTHLWNPIMLGALRALDLPYLLVIHDATLHPGEQLPLRQRWMDWEARRADGILALTEHVRRTVESRLGIKPERMAIVPHGPMTGLFKTPASTAPSSAETPRALLFFGRIIAYKGLDLLLDAYGILRARHSDLRLIICGGGDLAPYRAALDALPDVEIDNRYVAEEEIAAIVRRADLMILPYREASQSGVIALAEAAGIPVVATPVGGLIEQVRDGVNGVLARDMTAAAVAEAIERLLSDGDLFRRCAAGIVAHSQGRWDEGAGRIRALALRALDAKGRGADFLAAEPKDESARVRETAS